MTLAYIRRIGSAVLFAAMALALAASIANAQSPMLPERPEPKDPPAASGQAAAGKTVTLTLEEVDTMIAQLAEAPAKFTFGTLSVLLAKRQAVAPIPAPGAPAPR